jgi:hypothetical protein
MAGPLLSVGWQFIREMNPWQPILDPGMIAWRHYCGVVEAADGNIDFVCIWFGQKREWRAALWTKRTQTTGPSELARLSGGETKSAAVKRCPRHERSAATATAVQAVAVGNIIGLAGRFIADRTAQTTAADDVCIHCATIAQ